MESPRDAFEQQLPLERRSPLRERRDRMMLILHKKVQCTHHLVAVAEHLTVEGDIEAQVEQAWEEAIAMLGSDFTTELEECVHTLENIKKNLLAKHRRVQELPQEPIEIARMLRDRFEQLRYLRGSDIVRVIVRPFSIVLILSNEAFDSLFERDGEGVHLHDEPVQLIREMGPIETQETLRHEYVHALIGETVTDNDPLEAFELAYEDYEQLPETDKPAELLAITQAEPYLNDIHGELLAEIHDKNIDEFRQEDGVELQEGAFQGAIAGLATAGEDLGRLVKHLDRLCRRPTVTAAERVAFQGLSNTIQQETLRIVQQISDALFVASRLGAHVREEVDILLFLLQPSHYADLKFYLRARFGRAEVDTPLALEHLKRFSTTTDIMRGVEALKQQPALLTPVLQQQIEGRVELLQQQVATLTERASEETLEGARAFLTTTKELQTLCQSESPRWDELRRWYIWLFIRKHLRLQPGEPGFIPHLWKQLTNDERALYTRYKP